MDDKRFDNLARLVGRGASRRSILKGLLGIGGAAATGAVTAGDIDARPRGSRPTIPPPPPPTTTTTTPAPTTTTATPCTGFRCGLDCCDDELQCCDGECCPDGAVCLTQVFAEGPFVEEETCCPFALTCDNRCCDGECFDPGMVVNGSVLPLQVDQFEQTCCPAGGEVCSGDTGTICCQGDTPDCCRRENPDTFAIEPICIDRATQCCEDEECSHLNEPAACRQGECSRETQQCVLGEPCGGFDNEVCCVGGDNACCFIEDGCCGLSCCDVGFERCERTIDGVQTFSCINRFLGECCVNSDCFEEFDQGCVACIPAGRPNAHTCDPRRDGMSCGEGECDVCYQGQCLETPCPTTTTTTAAPTTTADPGTTTTADPGATTTPEPGTTTTAGPGTTTTALPTPCNDSGDCGDCEECTNDVCISFCDPGQVCCRGLNCCEQGLCNELSGECLVACQDASVCDQLEGCCGGICSPLNTIPNCGSCGNLCQPVDVCTPAFCEPGFPTTECNALSCGQLNSVLGGCCDTSTETCHPRGTLENCAACGDVCTSSDPCQEPVCFGFQHDPFLFECGTLPLCEAGNACCPDGQGGVTCIAGSTCPPPPTTTTTVPPCTTDQECGGLPACPNFCDNGVCRQDRCCFSECVDVCAVCNRVTGACVPQSCGDFCLECTGLDGNNDPICVTRDSFCCPFDPCTQTGLVCSCREFPDGSGECLCQAPPG